MANQFGWRPTTDPAKIADNARYDLRLLAAPPPPMGSVNVSFPYNREWIDEQNQGKIGACVGYSCSWLKSFHDGKLFNAYWLYKRAQAIDGDPNTSGDMDGAYLWAAWDVVKKEGHALYKTNTPDPAYKIISYWWAKSVDDIRSAAASGYPVVFGVPWFSEFSSPKRMPDGNYWIGTSKSWGSIQGGHAIYGTSVLDGMFYEGGPKGACAWLNTWGTGYAEGGPVYISYASIARLFSYRAECVVPLDYKPEPPPPPDPTDETMIVKQMTVIRGGIERTYAGELERVK